MTTPVRPRTPEDLPGCVRALAGTHRADGYPAVWPADPAGWLTPPGLLGAWVAVLDDAVVGHVVLTAGETAADALVSRLFVAPAGRRRGIGSRLLDRAHASAVDGRRSPVLEVAELGDGAAIALYERRGWVHAGSRTAGWTTADGGPVVLRDYRPPR